VPVGAVSVRVGVLAGAVGVDLAQVVTAQS